MYKDRKCYSENSFADAPEMAKDSGDKTEEATANHWVCGRFSVTDNARKQTLAYDMFFFATKTDSLVFQQMHLSHKIRPSFLMYTSK